MRFKSLAVREAGPLNNVKIDFKDVNLIVGDNEDGKTTLVDILIQKLLGKKNAYNKGFWNERFDFGGRSVVETEGDSPGEDVLKFSGLFIIREGDMKWQGKSAGKKEMLSREMWNEDVREVLYGSDEVYSKINKKSVELMGVSAGKGWLLKFLSNLGELDRIIESETARTEEFKLNETGIASGKKRLEAVEKKLESMTDARKISASMVDKDLIERFFKKTDELDKVDKERDLLLKKNLDAALEEWEKLERFAKTLEKDISGRDVGIQSREDMKKDKNRALGSLKSKYEQARDEMSGLDLERKKKLVDKENGERLLADKREQFAGKSIKAFLGTMNVLTSVFFLLAGASAAFLLLNYYKIIAVDVGWFVPAIPGGVSLTAAIVCLSTKFVRARNSANQLKRVEDDLKRKIEADSISVENLEKDLARTRKWMESLRVEMETLDREIGEIDDGSQAGELERSRKELDSVKNRLGELARQYQGQSEISRQIERRETLARQQADLRAELMETSGKLNKKYATVSAAFLNEELIKLNETLSNVPEDANYNEERFRKLLVEKDELGDDISRKQRENERIKAGVLTRTEEGLKNLLKDVKREYLDAFYSDSGTLGLKGDIFNIYALRGKTNDLMERVREDVRLAGVFLETLEKTQSDIGALLDSVLCADRFRSALEKLTDGNYRGLYAKEEPEGIRFYVENAKGLSYDFQSLSTGTRNQVYFALRLALAEQLFADRKGVFILDDAFLSFDEKRRRAAVEILEEYAARGWQIVYSSVNEKGMESLFDGIFGKKLNKVVLRSGV